MKKLLLIIAILISGMGLFAQNVGDNTIIDYEGYSLKFTVKNLEPAECEIKCSTKPTSSTEIVIPSSVTIEGMEFSVTSIGESAFYDCYNLTSIEIPNSVTSIGDRAFSSCYNLTSIEIPNSVTSIGFAAFYDCYNLTSIEIPNSVTSIGERAFYYCSNLTSIEIPNSVTSIIGNSAFSRCDNLTSITVEEGNPVYDSRNNCNAIIETETNTLIAGCQNTIIPNSVTYIGNDAFYSRDNLTSIEIPNSVTSIGNSAFFDCTSLTSIEIPNSVTSIGYSAFSYCSNLTSIEIPNSVTSIGDRAFSSCSNLTSITVEEGNHVYDSRNNCNAIIETETNTLIAGCQNTIIPNSVTSIGNSAFYSCDNLTSIEIPNSVTSIGNSAFYSCDNLTSITVEEGNHVYDSRNNCNAIIETETNTLIAGCQNTIIPNSVTSIGFAAFYDCYNLTSIEIPNSVTSIGNSAFYYCKNLTSIYCYAENVPETGSYAFSNCPSDMVIYVPAQSVDAYKAASLWNEYTIMAMDGEDDIVVNVGDSIVVDYDNYSLIYAITNLEPAECAVSGYEGEPVDVTIPSTATISGMEFSVTSIGDGAFSDCYNLTSIEIPNSITSIGNGAFQYCTSLTSIEIPNSVTYIDDNAFYYCSNLTSIEIPNSVTSIGNDAFWNCDNLTSIEIPNSVTSIGDGAFYDCDDLTSIEIPNSVTSIGDYAFFDCNNLTSITVEDGNPVYDSRNNCNAIIETETNTLIAGCQNTLIPNSVTSIGSQAFSNCDKLTSIEIPNSVTSIGNLAFYNCDNLTSIDFGENSQLTSIGYSAFSCCYNLTSIEIPNGVTSIGYNAFTACYDLTSIYCYAENVPETSSSAFDYCPSDMIIYVPAQSVDAYKAASPWNEYTIMAMGEPQFATEFFYDFNDGSLDGWRTFQDDNDNNNWMLNNNQGIDNSYCIYSYSYKNGIIFPDNYIVTTSKYSITETSTLTFASHPGVSGYFEDNYGVVVSEDNENWTVVWSEKFEEYYNEYTYKTVNLSAYAGKNIYIGFRHYETDGNVAEYVLIDNVKLSDNSNHWVPDESLYANNMSVIGLIQIDGVNQNSTSLEIGAFCGEEVRGSQLVQYIPALDKYLVFLTIHGEGSEEISFKLYDHFTEEELDLRSPEAITFAVNGTLGSVTSPYILNFSNMVEITAVVSPSEAGVVTGTGIYAIHDIVTLTTAPNEGFAFKNWTVNGNVVSTDSEYSFVVTEAVELVANYNYVQTRELKSGWSWFSSFIEFEGEEGLEMMEDALGGNGLQIKNQTEFVVNSDGAWYGSLMAANSDMMFMLETSAPQTFTLVGPKVNPEEHPLTVGTNWRWISYPLDINLSVDEALATIVPQTGDYIKSKNAFSQYYEGAGWLGALSTMNPGEGYMYQNVSGTTKTLVYPSAPTTRSTRENVTAENNYWVPNAEKFAGNMSVIAVVESNGIEMSDYEVAAFVGDEIRGSARPIYIEVLDKHMIFMTVYGSGKEEITFKYYDINADAIENVTSREEIVFADNATYGSIENATVLTCGVTGIGENDTETLNVYPNPANINAEISLGTTYDRVEIYNAIGVKIAEYADVNRIGGIETSGVYVIKVTNDDATRNCRIVVR